MKKLCKRDISASEISEFLNIPWKGKDYYVSKPVSIETLDSGTISFSNGICDKNVEDGLCIVSNLCESSSCHQLLSKTPELDFYRVVNEFYMDEINEGISTRAEIEDGSKIGQGVSIGDNTFIGSEVEIGSNSNIGRNVAIYGRVKLGRYCIVKDNAVIGSTSYDFIKDGEFYVSKPSLGTINIGDDVLIGSNTTIELPKFGETIISSNVKIDDLVNIGSNCKIGLNTLVSAGTVICHGVSIGNNCNIGSCTGIRENIRIEDNVKVGLGSTIITDLKQGNTYAGNPANKIKSEEK